MHLNLQLRMTSRVVGLRFTLTALIFGLTLCLAGLAFAQGSAGSGASGSNPIAQLETACGAGNGQACSELGAMLRFSTDPRVQKDEARARQLFERACVLNFGEGCRQLARVQMAGSGGPRDAQAALASYQKGCALKVPAACYAYGYAHEIGGGTAINRPVSAINYKRACELAPNDPTYCPKARATATYLPAQVPKPLTAPTGSQSPVTGLQCRAAASAVMRFGQTGLASARALAARNPTDSNALQLIVFWETEISSARAVDLKFAGSLAPSPEATRAMEASGAASLKETIQSCLAAPRPAASAPATARASPPITPTTPNAAPEATSNAGTSLDRRARSLRTSLPVEARRLYEQSCTSGSMTGCFGLGWMLHNSRGGPGDRPRALGLIERSCASDVGEACDYLGYIHEYGSGITVDETKARAHYQKACTLNVPEGCLNIALMQLDGRGGVKTERAARINLETSCRLGDRVGCSTLASVRTSGKGGPVDLPGAATAKTQACQLGLASACSN